MTKETYLRYRKLFEEKYESKKTQSSLEYVNLYDLKNSIRNFELFLNIYKHDKKPWFSNIVSSIDNRKRFIIDRYPALKIKLMSNVSMVDNWSDEYDKIHAYSSLKQK